jgi:hypothetical protein
MFNSEQFVKVRCVYNNREYWIEKGYTWEVGTFIEVIAKDLPRGSGAKVEINCDSCNGKLSRSYAEVIKNNKVKHYCNRECLSNDNSLLKNCAVCEKEYRIPRHQEKTNNCCSKKCASIFSRKSFEINCDYCSKAFITKPAKYNQSKNHFCSYECSHKAKKRNEEKWRLVSCLYCKEEYEALISNKNTKYCSVKCRNNWESENLIGENHHSFKSVKLECDYCKKEHFVQPHKLNDRDNHLCSKECRLKWYAEIYSQTDEVKNRSRINAVNTLNKYKYKTLTWCQDEVNNILSEMVVKFENEYNCKYYSIDNYLPDENLMIEVMGSFWHADHREYSEISYDMQLRGIKCDKAKSTYVKRYKGINILYLWEKDIADSPEMIRHLIIKYIHSDGLIEDYHSFNYSMSDDELILNESIDIPYMKYNIKKLKPFVNLKSGSDESKRQEDKWLTFNCNYCDKETEQLISKYEKNVNHYCSKECSDKGRIGKTYDEYMKIS